MFVTQVVVSITMDDWEELKEVLGNPEPLIDHSGVLVDEDHREQPGRKRRKE